MKINQVLWFTGPQGTIGIVLAHDEHSGDPKAYIGLGEGFNSGFDTGMISNLGAPFMPQAAKQIFEHFNPAKPKG